MTILLIFFLLILISVQGAQKITMESGTETFVSKDSKLYQDYDHLYSNIFGTNSIIVMVEGNDVESADIMKSVDRLEHQLESTEGIVGVTSPASIIKEMNYQNTGRSQVPDTDAEIKEIIDGNPATFGTLIPDHTHMVIYLTMAGSSTDNKQKEIITETEEAVKFSDFPPSYNLIVTGDPAYKIEMSEAMSTGMGPLLGLAAVFMVIVLSLVFRHVRWCLLPLPVVLLGIVYTFGAMGFLGIPLSMVSMSAFPVLIGLGIDYAIQFHNRIEEELHKEGNKSKAIISTIKHTGPAVLIALTMTALGFFSLFTSTVPMIQDFGKLLTIGILMCYLAAMFVGVVTVYIFDDFSKNLKSKKGKNEPKPTETNADHVSSGKPKNNLVKHFLEKINNFSIKNNLLILGIATLLCIGGIYADESVGAQTDTTSFAPRDLPALMDLNHMKDITGGTDTLNLIIKVKDNADPEVLEWIDRFSEHETQRQHIESTLSIVPLIKEYNGGTIPETRDEIEAIYNEIPESQKNRYVYGRNMLLLNLNIGNAVSDIETTGIEELTGIIDKDIQWMQVPPGVTVTITGNPVVYIEVLGALTDGRILMTYLGLFLVLGGLLVVYRDWLKALAAIIPMFIVTGWSGLVMKFLGILYTPMTATMGALIIGIGCEYSVLMMERYFEEKDHGADPLQAIHRTSENIGAALLASGSTVIGGFAALTISPFPLIGDFGTVTVIDIVLVLIATFMVFPPFIVLMDTWREKRRGIQASQAKANNVKGADTQ
ncbi:MULTISPECIES: efflux RND transporter permease subunit [Methanosarcina]|uniref:RND superfamily transporter n=3 Tax=Methanosarcina barkeri TaxID=2208 RepID=A0A0G3C6Y9_METBA|nr:MULTISPECIES: RND family transporter [Methanosarcina]AKJ37746.1 RND superfamily transporter [Methanosarcina barkeri CM1]